MALNSAEDHSLSTVPLRTPPFGVPALASSLGAKGGCPPSVDDQIRSGLGLPPRNLDKAVELAMNIVDGVRPEKGGPKLSATSLETADHALGVIQSAE